MKQSFLVPAKGKHNDHMIRKRTENFTLFVMCAQALRVDQHAAGIPNNAISHLLSLKFRNDR
jgi:hypothetical protein